MMEYEVRCRVCETALYVTVELVRQKSGLYQFQCECHQCYSGIWYIQYSELNRAVKRYMEKLKP